MSDIASASGSSRSRPRRAAAVVARRKIEWTCTRVLNIPVDHAIYVRRDGIDHKLADDERIPDGALELEELPPATQGIVWHDSNRRDVVSVRCNPRSEGMGLLYHEVVYGDRNDRRKQEMRAYTREEFLALFDVQLLRFIEDPAYVEVTAEMYARYNFGKASKDKKVYREGMDLPADWRPEWIISSIWRSDGSDGEIAGRFYATDAADGRKYELDFYSFESSGAARQEDTAIDVKDASISFGRVSRVENMVMIDKFCSRFPGRRLRLNRAMSRFPSKRAPDHFSNRTVRFGDKGDECVRAAIANALYISDATSLALRFFKAEIERDAKFKAKHGYRMVVRDNNDIVKELQGTYGGVDLDFVKRKVGGKSVSVRNFSPSFFTRREVEGVFVLRLIDKSRSSHAICIDTREDPGLVYDCSESFAMKLCDESISLCVGDGEELQEIDDVRRVIVHSTARDEGKKKRHRSKSKRRAEKKRRE